MNLYFEILKYGNTGGAHLKTTEEIQGTTQCIEDILGYGSVS
jgi:hypothetical protein